MAQTGGLDMGYAIYKKTASGMERIRNLRYKGNTGEVLNHSAWVNSLETVWGNLSNIGDNRTCDQGLSYNGKLYAISGVLTISPGSYVMTDSCKAYDIITDTWSNIAPIPQVTAAYAAVIYNAKIYVFGGDPYPDNVSTNALTDKVQIYDIVTDTWTTLTVMPDKRATHRAVVVGQYIYILGGYAENSVWDGKYWRFDPIDNSFTYLGVMPWESGYMGVASIDDKVYIFGGEGIIKYNYVYEYSTVTNAWTRKNNGELVIGYSAAAMLNGELYILSENNLTGAFGATFLKYDVSTDAFTVIMPYDPSQLSARVALVTFESELYIYGNSKTQIFNGVSSASKRINI